MTSPVGALPSLETGDRMDRAEFHRRYLLRPDIRRAELVEGVVYVPSPMRIDHDEPAGLCYVLLRTYARRHPGVRAGGGGTVILDDRNEVQPDAFLWRPEPGVVTAAHGYVRGAPQLIAEIAASTARYDATAKRETYRRNGVREYLLWRVEERTIMLLRLVDGAYAAVAPSAAGMLESEAFPGLRFAVAALLAGDDESVLAALAPRP